MTWIPEFVSILILVLIPFRTAINKESNVPIKYIILIILYLAHLIIGFLLNDVSGWVVLSGTRIYTKFLPIFLVLLIFPLSEKEFKRLFLFVFILGMMQFPIVVMQRFVFYAGTLSGDPMGGTLGHSASGILAIFMVIVMSFLIAFYLKELISLRVFIIAFAAAFIPITLNETKISFILLPVAFIVTAFFVRGKAKTIFRIFIMLVLLVMAFFVLKGIYDYFQEKRWGYGIGTFVSTPGRLEEYNQRRVDPLKYSFTYAATKDIRYSVFGRGAGNASRGFTRTLNGKYLQERLRFGYSNLSFSIFVWEIGLIGTFFFMLFPLFISFDAIQLSKEQGFLGAFSLGLITFSLFFILSFFYTHSIDSNLLVYLFFLMGGYVVSRKKILLKTEDLQLQEPYWLSLYDHPNSH